MRRLHEFILEGVLVLLCIVLACRAPNFLTPGNLFNILQSASMQGVIAFGMTMVIIAGEIDLSVGSGVAFTGCITAWVALHLPERVPPALAVLIGAACAMLLMALSGAISGLLRVRFNVPTFISTLAWFLVLRGAAGQLTHGFPIASFPPGFSVLGAGHLGPIPVPALIFLGIFLLAQLLMSFTTFGRSIYAVGGNAEAARLSGIPVGLVKTSVMVIVALLAALAGLMQASQISSGDPKTAMGWELDVIASVIIGGTSLTGGAGRIWGTFIGILFLGLLINGMTLMNVSPYWQDIVRGGLILLAVLLNATLSKRR